MSLHTLLHYWVSGSIDRQTMKGGLALLPALLPDHVPQRRAASLGDLRVHHPPAVEADALDVEVVFVVLDLGCCIAGVFDIAASALDAVVVVVAVVEEASPVVCLQQENFFNILCSCLQVCC